MQSLFAGQGLVFWAAIIAVTLGLTLLSVSIAFQIRRMLRGRRLLWRKLRLPGKRRAAAKRPSPQITVTAEGYRAEGYLPDRQPAEPVTAAEDAGLRPLLNRLRAAGDRLDRTYASLGPQHRIPSNDADSPLKLLDDDVDYVYKTGSA
jgi:hypothetical protein